MSVSFFCPNCKKEKLNVKTSKWICDQCHSEFPIINSIPRFVEKNNYSESFGYQWNIHQKTQLDSNIGIPISYNRLKRVAPFIEELNERLNVLEAGSGAGRFTEILVKSEANIFSFDYSNAVEANLKNNGMAKNLTLFQGDIYNIPFKPAQFDYVICLGVIQHTPDPEKAFFSLLNQVRPGGMICIDVYTKSWHHFFQWKYFLRPLTKRIKPEALYGIIAKLVPYFIPFTKILKKIFGKYGARLSPIVEYSNLSLSEKQNVEWAILDTFDMYSPAHDHPKSFNEVESWFKNANIKEYSVFYGENGVVAKGKVLDTEIKRASYLQDTL